MKPCDLDPDEPAFLREWSWPAPSRRIDASSLMATFLDEVALGNIPWDGDVTASIWGRIRAIDTALSRQLAAIMHHPDFQMLEGTWRGRRYLADRTETSDRLKIELLDVSRSEPSSDPASAPELDQSPERSRAVPEVAQPGSSGRADRPDGFPIDAGSIDAL